MVSLDDAILELPNEDRVSSAHPQDEKGETFFIVPLLALPTEREFSTIIDVGKLGWV